MKILKATDFSFHRRLITRSFLLLLPVFVVALFAFSGESMAQSLNLDLGEEGSISGRVVSNDPAADRAEPCAQHPCHDDELHPHDYRVFAT